RHTRFSRDWSSDVCSSDLRKAGPGGNGLGVFPTEPLFGQILQKGIESLIHPTPLTFVGVYDHGKEIMPHLVDDHRDHSKLHLIRSEERRVGKECRSRWWES